MTFYLCLLLMRIVDYIPHESLMITLMEMNEKYILKLEGGPMEQTYKLDKGRVSTSANMKILVDEIFVNECVEHFNSMFKSLTSSLERNKL